MRSDLAPTVTFVRLSAVDPAALIALMNDPRVRRHLPLARGVFGPEACAAFVAAKERIWHEHGFGPWAFYADGVLAGWGGLQPEGDDIDLGIVLHPDYWGLGPGLYARLAAEAFGTLGARSVTVLLPRTRKHTAALERAGLVLDGEVVVEGVPFRRFRLHAPRHSGT